MAIITWFEADEDNMCCGSYTGGVSKDFISLITEEIFRDGKLWIDRADAYVVQLDTDTDGLPHRKMMCSFRVFDLNEELDTLAEFIDDFAADDDDEIWDAITLDNHIVITLRGIITHHERIS